MSENELKVKEILDPIIALGVDCGAYLNVRMFLHHCFDKAQEGNASAEAMLDIATKFSRMVQKLSGEQQ